MWYSIFEISGLPGLPSTVRGIRKKATREKWVNAPRQGLGGGKVYHLSSLPIETQSAIEGQVEGAIAQKAQPKVIALPSIATEMIGVNSDRSGKDSDYCEGAIAPQPQPTTDQIGDPLRSLPKLQPQPALPEIQPLPEYGVAAVPVGDRKQQERDAKLSILTMLADFCAKHKLGICKAREEFAKRFNQKALAIADWIRERITSISVQKLRRWQKALRASGNPNVLLRSQGKARKRKSIIDTNAEMKAVVEGMLLYRSDHIEAELKARGFEDVPSLRTLERWVKKWRQANPALYAALQNKHLYNSKFRPAFGSVTEDVVYANQRWQIDATKADIRLEDGSRYSILLIVDGFSRRLKAFVCKTSNAKNLVQGMLRRAILGWGVPAEIDHDLGKEFLSAYFLGCLSALDINNRPCNAFSPWEKGNVERAFGSVTRELFERLPGFCGHNVAEAQAIRSHGAKDIELRLTPEALQKRLDEWCHEYEQRPHQGLEGKTPLERWAESPVPIKKIENIRALDLLLAETPDRGGIRIVQKQGIQIGNHFYADRDGEWTLHLGKPVKVKFDPYGDDAGKIYVFEPGAGGDDEFLFVAVAPELSGDTRQEIAIAAHEAMREQVNPEVKRLKALAKAVERTSPIVSDRNKPSSSLLSLVSPVQPAKRQTKVEVTVVPFQKSETHECAALSEAAQALALLDEIAAKRIPAPMTVEELAVRKEQEQKIEQMQTAPKQSDAERYSDLWFAAREGRNLPPTDVAFMGRYESTASGKSVKNTLELLHMGQDTG